MACNYCNDVGAVVDMETQATMVCPVCHGGPIRPALARAKKILGGDTELQQPPPSSFTSFEQTTAWCSWGILSLLVAILEAQGYGGMEGGGGDAERPGSRPTEPPPGETEG